MPTKFDLSGLRQAIERNKQRAALAEAQAEAQDKAQAQGLLAQGMGALQQNLASWGEDRQAKAQQVSAARQMAERQARWEAEMAAKANESTLNRQNQLDLTRLQGENALKAQKARPRPAPRAPQRSEADRARLVLLQSLASVPPALIKAAGAATGRYNIGGSEDLMRMSDEQLVEVLRTATEMWPDLFGGQPPQQQPPQQQPPQQQPPQQQPPQQHPDADAWYKF